MAEAAEAASSFATPVPIQAIAMTEEEAQANAHTHTGHRFRRRTFGYPISARIQNEYTVFKRYRLWRGTVSPDACKPVRILQANDVTSTPIHLA